MQSGRAAATGIDHTWAALRSIRAARPDSTPIYVILDNLSAHLNWRIRRWAAQNKVELCFTPTYASWANPIEAHVGPLRQFTLANSNHPNQTRALHAYLRRRNHRYTIRGPQRTAVVLELSAGEPELAGEQLHVLGIGGRPGACWRTPHPSPDAVAPGGVLLVAR
ncbi:hypothetical protein ABIE67_001259 [Streptomyces sp. V4I8]